MWNVRCRNKKCRHRRLTDVHPDETRLTYRCPKCGELKGWRIENQSDRREKCNCGGPLSETSDRSYPHHRGHPLCNHHPYAAYNQAKARGVEDSDIPFEFLPPEVKDAVEKQLRELCPF